MRVVSSLFIAAALLFFSACSSSKVSYEKDGMNHQEKRLSYMKRMLNDLNSVVHVKHKSEMERDDDRRRYAGNFADTLKMMSSKVADFPKDDANFKIDSSKLRDFEELSKRLYTQGEVIQKIADSYDFKSLNRAIDDVKSTCMSCHKLVRLGFNPLKEETKK